MVVWRFTTCFGINKCIVNYLYVLEAGCDQNTKARVKSKPMFLGFRVENWVPAINLSPLLLVMMIIKYC